MSTSRHAPTSSALHRALPLRLGLVVAVSVVLSFLHRHVYLDDAFIYARYIHNAMVGHGLVFNLNERVNALSSPAYSYLVLLLAKLSGAEVFGVSVFVSAASMLLACVLAELLVPLGGLLLASTGFFYTLFGMETSLFLALLLLPACLVSWRRPFWIPTAVLLLSLTRFEGMALLPTLGYVLYRRRLRPSWLSLLPPLVILCFYLSLNLHWYGSLLPASAGAKLGQGRSGFWGVWPHAFFAGAYQLKPDFLPEIPVVLAVCVLAIPGCFRLRHSALLQISLPFLAVLLAFYVLFNIPGYRWYFAPFIAFALLYAMAALPKGPSGLILAGTLVCVSAFVAVPRGSFPASSQPPAASGVLQGYPAIGLWLSANTRPGTRVEAGEIGTLGWFCQSCHILDILGLTLPKNAEHVAHGDAVSWFAEDHPDYIVVHTPPWGFEKPALASPNYVPVPVDFGPSVRLLKRIPTPDATH